MLGPSDNFITGAGWTALLEEVVAWTLLLEVVCADGWTLLLEEVVAWTFLLEVVSTDGWTVLLEDEETATRLYRLLLLEAIVDELFVGVKLMEVIFTQFYY